LATNSAKYGHSAERPKKLAPLGGHVTTVSWIKTPPDRCRSSCDSAAANSPISYTAYSATEARLNAARAQNQQLNKAQKLLQTQYDELKLQMSKLSKSRPK